MVKEIGPGQHWLLWDGDCGFCQHSVDWIKARDKRDIFFPVAYQVAPSPPMTPEIYEACSRAVHVVTSDGRVLAAGRAALFMMEQIGWGGLAKVLSLPLFIWAVEIGYKIVAANRMFFSRLFFPRASQTAACRLPSAGEPRQH